MCFGQLVRWQGGAFPAVVWANIGGGVFLFTVLGSFEIAAKFVAGLFGRTIRSIYPISLGSLVFLLALNSSNLTPPVPDLKAADLRASTPSFTTFISASQRSTAEMALATRFRPLLFFDSAEPLRPLGIDNFLTETRIDGSAEHRVCTRRTHRPDNCSPLRGALGLWRFIKAPANSYLDLDDESWQRRDQLFASQRVYYHLVRTDTRIYLDYWWFFRYNRSPVWSDWFCLPGLAVASATCFDHEGDWEGVTVSVPVTNGRADTSLEAVKVRYAGHEWNGYWYSWPTLRRFGSVVDSHPRVYVAYGSHASYPVRCPGRSSGLLSGCTNLISVSMGGVYPTDGMMGNHRGDSMIRNHASSSAAYTSPDY